MVSSQRRSLYPGFHTPQQNTPDVVSVFRKYHNQFPQIREIHYENNGFIFEKNEPARWVYLLTKGEVDLVKRLSNGKRFIIERLVAGELLGIESLLSIDLPSYRAYSAETVGRVEAILIECDVFFELMKYPDVALAINLHLIQQLRKSDQRAGYLLCQDARSKVVGALKYFHDLQPASEKNTETAILPITVSQLASFAGLAVETVFKQVAILKQKKVISKVENGKIKIALEQVTSADI